MSIHVYVHILDVCKSHLHRNVAVPLQALIARIPSKSKAMSDKPCRLHHRYGVLGTWTSSCDLRRTLAACEILTELAWRMGISEWIRPVTWPGLTNSLKIHSPGRISHADDSDTIPAQPFFLVLMAGTKLYIIHSKAHRHNFTNGACLGANLRSQAGGYLHWVRISCT